MLTAKQQKKTFRSWPNKRQIGSQAMPTATTTRTTTKNANKYKFIIYHFQFFAQKLKISFNREVGRRAREEYFAYGKIQKPQQQIPIYMGKIQ